MAVLPTEIPVGTITGQFYFVSEDNIDADTDPSLIPVTGNVNFTCSAKVLRMPGKFATIIPLTFKAKFDAQGRLIAVNDPTPGLKLPATDTTDISPRNYTWKVEFDLKQAGNGYSINIPSFDISVPAGQTIDLTSVTPVDMSPGTITIAGPKGDPNVLSIGTVTTGAAGSAAAATITGTSPAQTLNLAIPKGDPGIADDASVAALVPASSGSATSAALSATILNMAAPPINVLAKGADATGATDSTAAIQAAIDEAAAVSGAGSGTRKVILPGKGGSATATYLINSRLVIPKYVVLAGESGMTKIKCGTATAGVDVGDGINVPYHAELNDVLIDANFVANNPLVFNKVSEVYSRRAFVTNLTDAGQGIKLDSCLGVTLENPSISRNSVQPHGVGVGIRITGTSAGYIVVRDHNFFNLRDAFRFETGVSNLVVNEGWNEWITNYETVAVTTFASFGQLIADKSHFTGTDAIHRLWYLEKADAGYSVGNAEWTRNRLIGASVTSALIDISAVANTAGTTSFNLEKNDWQLGAGANVLAKHAGTPWYQTYVQIDRFKNFPYAKLPVHGVDCQLTHMSSLGWNRFANGFSVNGDPLRTDGHVKWNSTTKRWQMDTTNTGVYSDIPVSGDYSSAAAVADKVAVFATGSYYTPRGARSAFAATADRLTVVPFLVPKSQQFVRIGAEVTVAAASSTVRLGIYNIGPTGLPTSLVLDAGTIDASTIGAKEITIDTGTLPAGLYGLAAVANGGTPTVRTITGGGGIEVGNGSLASSTQSNPNTGFYMSGVTGALPGTFTLTDRFLSPTLVSVRTA